MQTNYYKILELPYNASVSDVKRAYREKAKSFHPDVSCSEAAKKEFQLLNQAYSVLSDAEARRKYDILLFYRYSVMNEHFKKRKRKSDQRKGSRKRRRSHANGKNMTSTARGYRYYKPDPPPIFKFGIYATGIVFGVCLFILTSISLLTKGWPIVSAFILVPASIVTYQGWNGMNEHRNEAGKYLLKGWGRLLEHFGKSKEKQER